jgi:hypothetical protein
MVQGDFDGSGWKLHIIALVTQVHDALMEKSAAFRGSASSSEQFYFANSKFPSEWTLD